MRSAKHIIRIGLTILLASAAVAAVPASRLHAQHPVPGTRLRARLWTGRTVKGSAIRVSDDTVVLSLATGPVSIPVTAIKSLAATEGMRRSTGTGFLVGAGTMFAIGFIYGHAEYDPCSSSGWCFFDEKEMQWSLGAIGAATGGVVGLVIGHFVKHEKWVSAPAVQVQPAGPGRYSLSVRIHQP